MLQHSNLHYQESSPLSALEAPAKDPTLELIRVLDTNISSLARSLSCSVDSLKKLGTTKFQINFPNKLLNFIDEKIGSSTDISARTQLEALRGDFRERFLENYYGIERIIRSWILDIGSTELRKVGELHNSTLWQWNNGKAVPCFTDLAKIASKLDHDLCNERDPWTLEARDEWRQVWLDKRKSQCVPTLVARLETLIQFSGAELISSRIRELFKITRSSTYLIASGSPAPLDDVSRILATIRLSAEKRGSYNLISEINQFTKDAESKWSELIEQEDKRSFSTAFERVQKKTGVTNRHLANIFDIKKITQADPTTFVRSTIKSCAISDKLPIGALILTVTSDIRIQGELIDCFYREQQIKLRRAGSSLTNLRISRELWGVKLSEIAEALSQITNNPIHKYTINDLKLIEQGKKDCPVKEIDLLEKVCEELGHKKFKIFTDKVAQYKKPTEVSLALKEASRVIGGYGALSRSLRQGDRRTYISGRDLLRIASGNNSDSISLPCLTKIVEGYGGELTPELINDWAFRSAAHFEKEPILLRAFEVYILTQDETLTEVVRRYGIDTRRCTKFRSGLRRGTLKSSTFDNFLNEIGLPKENLTGAWLRSLYDDGSSIATSFPVMTRKVLEDNLIDQFTPLTFCGTTRIEFTILKDFLDIEIANQKKIEHYKTSKIELLKKIIDPTGIDLSRLVTELESLQPNDIRRLAYFGDNLYGSGSEGRLEVIAYRFREGCFISPSTHPNDVSKSLE